MIGAGRLGEAESVLSRNAARFTDNSAIHHLRGRIAMMHGKWTAAVSELQRASLIDEEDPWLLADLARAQLAAGHHADCLTTIRQLKGAFNDVDLENEIDRLHCRCLVDAHRFREAHRLLCTFTDEHPDDIDAWIDLSLVCREVGDHNRMRKAATRVASLDRGRFEGHFLLGCSFMDEGKATDAIRCFKEAASIAPQRPQTWMALGLAYEHANEPGLAIEAYGRADSNQGRALIAQVEMLDD
jgi:predicted Zn-dependent protease